MMRRSVATGGWHGGAVGDVGPGASVEKALESARSVLGRPRMGLVGGGSSRVGYPVWRYFIVPASNDDSVDDTSLH